MKSYSLLLPFLPALCLGADYYWKGPLDGRWNNGPYWTLNDRPTSTENVFLGYAPGVVFTPGLGRVSGGGDSIQFGNLTLAATLDLAQSNASTRGVSIFGNGEKLELSRSQIIVEESSRWRNLRILPNASYGYLDSQISLPNANKQLVLDEDCRISGSGSINVSGSASSLFHFRGVATNDAWTFSDLNFRNANLFDIRNFTFTGGSFVNTGTININKRGLIKASKEFQNTGTIRVAGFKSLLTVEGYISSDDIRKIKIDPSNNIEFRNPTIENTNRVFDLNEYTVETHRFYGFDLIGGELRFATNPAYNPLTNSISLNNVYVRDTGPIKNDIRLSGTTMFQSNAPTFEGSYLTIDSSYTMTQKLTATNGALSLGKATIPQGADLRVLNSQFSFISPLTVQGKLFLSGVTIGNSNPKLIVDGGSISGSLRMWQGHLIISEGMVDAELVLNDSLLEVGRGTLVHTAGLSVLGNQGTDLYLRPEATTSLMLDDSKPYSMLFTGLSVLNGHLVVRRGPSTVTTVGKEYVLLQSSFPIEGTFSSLDIPSHWEIIYSTNQVKLKINRRTTAVPEPSSLAATVISLLLIRRRRSGLRRNPGSNTFAIGFIGGVVIRRT